MNTVYLETTVVGTIASRDHPDPVILTRQVISRQWWSTAYEKYSLYISDLVISECSAGDPTAADERLQLVGGIALLTPSESAESLTEKLIEGKAIPVSEPRDAAHIALAAVHDIDFLVTWNFKHILNSHTQHLIEKICRDNGYESATICTPEQLMEADNDTQSD